MKKINLTIMLSIILILVFSTISYGADEEFRLDIDNLNLEEGVSTNLVLTIKNAKGAQKLKIEGLDKFKVLSQGTASEMRIVNGKASRIKRYNYRILPLEKGEFALQGIIEYKGKTYQTNELKVKVSKKKNKQSNESRNIFIKTTLSKDKLYFGEKVILKYELFTRYNIEGAGFLDGLSLDDFMVNDLSSENIEKDYVNLNGRKYLKVEVKSLVLTPTKTGNLTIPSFDFQANIGTRDFFSSTKPKYLRTDAKNLEVLPLPQEGKPDDFSGVVGSLNLDSSFSKGEVEYGDSLTLEVNLAGNCNLDNLERIIDKDLDNFKVYQSEKDKKEQFRDGHYYAEKNFDLILVPKESGKVEFPELKISYFDTKSGEYSYATIKGEEIIVKGEAEKEEVITSNKADSNETIEISQISYDETKNNEDYYSLKIKKIYLKIFLLVLFSGLFLILIVFIIRRYRDDKDDRLKEFYKSLKKASSDDEIYSLFNEMIKYSYGISLKASSKDEIKRKIDNDRLLREIYEVIDYVENKRYKSSSLDLKKKVKDIYD